MFREWLAYGSDAKRIAEAFTGGINAYIDMIDDQPELLPPEFNLLDYQPTRWKPEDTVRIRSHGISMNVDKEAIRAQITCLADLETAEYWSDLEPQWTTEVPDGLDPCAVPGKRHGSLFARQGFRSIHRHSTHTGRRKRTIDGTGGWQQQLDNQP